MNSLRRKGFALIWSMILVTIIITVATTVATSIVKDSKMTINSSDSLQAYSAAQTGIDIAKTLFTGESAAAFNFEGDVGGAHYKVDYDPNVNIVGSTGTIRNISRRIEYIPVNQKASPILKNEDVLAAAQGSATKAVSVEDSFSLSFSFWNRDTLGNAIDQKVSLSSPSDNSAITVLFNYSTIEIKATKADGTQIGTSERVSLPAGVERYYSYRVKISYLKNAYLKYSVSGWLSSNQTRTCENSGSIPLNGVNLTGAPRLTIDHSPVIIAASTELSSYIGTVANGLPAGYGMDTFIGTGLTIGAQRVNLNLSTPVGGHIDYSYGSIVGTCSDIDTCGAITVDVGTTVLLTAEPDASSNFTGWAGACSGTGACNVTVNSDTTVTAFFASSGTAKTDRFASGSGKWTVPSGVTSVDVTVIGGGGGGGAGGCECGDWNLTYGDGSSGGNTSVTVSGVTFIAYGGAGGKSGDGGGGNGSSGSAGGTLNPGGWVSGNFANGGAGGEGDYEYDFGGNGGNGGKLFKASLAVTPGQQIDYTVGAGGAGGDNGRKGGDGSVSFAYTVVPVVSINLTQNGGGDCPGWLSGNYTAEINGISSSNTYEIWRWNGTAFVLQASGSNVTNGFSSYFSSYKTTNGIHYTTFDSRGYIRVHDNATGVTTQSNTLDMQYKANDDFC